jgi:4a-hydroxytetrahydrobiopterin dehydratase
MPGVLDKDSIEEALQKLEFNWQVEGKVLSIEAETKVFNEAVWVINEVAKIAGELNHHPDIELKNYNKLSVHLSTHDAGGITDKDLALAEKIDAILSRTSQPK